MAIAIVLLLMVAGSVAFHLLTPWWLSPLASDWQAMDDTLAITVVVTGTFFVAINLFIVYTLLRFRHRPGAGPRPAGRADNRRLELGLVGVTTVGIIALLAPGLTVYARYVQPPATALVLEVVGQQWQWHYRFAGADGRLGRSDAHAVSSTNPLGLDPADVHGLDDIVIIDSEVHLPLGRPVQVLLRSNDVLHDFFVPPFRARMNMVPGQVSSFWFTPTRAGRFEAMCAQLCGLGHPAMHGYVVVEDLAAWQAWMNRQSTQAALANPTPGTPSMHQQP
jgi:cytochrome c oxidase subunit 2